MLAEQLQRLHSGHGARALPLILRLLLQALDHVVRRDLRALRALLHPLPDGRPDPQFLRNLEPAFVAERSPSSSEPDLAGEKILEAVLLQGIDCSGLTPVPWRRWRRKIWTLLRLYPLPRFSPSSLKRIEWEN
jgi:hypothetical protein